MKKINKILAMILLVCLLAAPASALSGTVSQTLEYPNIRITLDGHDITPMDVTGKTVDPFIIDGTTYLPVRAISEALGFDVAWDGGNNTVTIRSGAGETASHALIQEKTTKSGTETASLLYNDIQISVDGKTIIPTDANGKVVEPFVIDGTTYLPIYAISEALGCTITWNGATNTASIVSPQAQAAASHTLKAGVGIGEINFDADYLRSGTEGFSGEYLDVPHARVLLLEDETTVAIVSLELVQASAVMDQMQEIVSKALDLPVSQIWIHCTHATTTPHPNGDTAPYMEAVSKALNDACSQAKASLQPAVMGVGTVELDINANRNIPKPAEVPLEQWTARNSSYGLGGTEYSDKELTIVRFDSLNGDPIGFYMSYPMKPSGLDQAGKDGSERLITADVQGVACTMVEEELGGVCLFMMPAAADQISKESATFNGMKEDGTWGQINLSVEEGIDIIERYGAQMGGAAIELAKGITTDVSDADIQVSYTTFDGTAVERDGSESPTTVRVDAITLGDSVSIIGFLPELDAWTGHEIKEASPYDTTLLVSFLNGDSKYMPHDDAYNYNDGIGTQETQSGSAAYARGTAEKLVQASAELLTRMQESAGTETVIFVHTNDVHGHVSVEPYVKAVADAYKETYGNSNVYTVSAGDVFAGGESIAHMTKGESIVEIMNAAGYQALTLGNNDIREGLAWLLHLGEEADFPILAANMITNGVDPELGANGDHPLQEYTIFTTESGVRIGVFGLTTVLAPSTNDSTPYAKTATIETARACVNTLKEKENCDIIVALTHTGWPDNDDTFTAVSSNDTNSYQLAMEVPGIDLVIDGHTHSVINEGSGYVCGNENNTLIVQAGYFGDYIGVTELKIRTIDKSIVRKEATLLSEEEYTSNYTADAVVATAVEKWESQLNEIFAGVVGSTDYFLSAERASAAEDGKGIRMAEQNLGNLVTDAIREGSGTDIAWLSGVMIRASIEAGDITLLDCYNVFANGGYIYACDWTGAQIKEYLQECSASAARGEESAAFKQVSGIHFSYNNDGVLVSAELEDGTPIEDNTIYHIAGNFTVPPDDTAVLIYDGIDELVEMFCDYLASDAYNTQNYAGKQGRITEV